MPVSIGLLSHLFLSFFHAFGDVLIESLPSFLQVGADGRRLDGLRAPTML